MELLLINRNFSGEKTFKAILKENDFSPTILIKPSHLDHVSLGFARLVFT